MERARGGLGRWLRVLPHLLACMALVGACGGPKKPRTYEAWKEQATISGDFDEAEARWRREISQNPWSEEEMNRDMRLLTDNPPRPPEEYGDAVVPMPGGDVAFVEDTGDPEADADAESDQFWEDVGTASFSAFTVLFTVGMAVAPYFLL